MIWQDKNHCYKYYNMKTELTLQKRVCSHTLKSYFIQKFIDFLWDLPPNSYWGFSNHDQWDQSKHWNFDVWHCCWVTVCKIMSMTSLKGVCIISFIRHASVWQNHFIKKKVLNRHLLKNRCFSTLCLATRTCCCIPKLEILLHRNRLCLMHHCSQAKESTTDIFP